MFCVHFLFYSWFSYQILRFWRNGVFFFKFHPWLIFLYLSCKIQSIFCSFFNLFHFFFVLSSILCKIEFSTLLDPCYVATVLGAWALCRILTHVDNRVYQGFLFGSLPGCHCMLSLLSVSATCCVILSHLLIWVTNFPSTHLIHLWSLFWNKKTHYMIFVFALCITFL